MRQDYAVKVSVRNGRILRRMRDLNYTNQREFAEQFNIPYTMLNALITMRAPAYNKQGEWYPIVLNLAAALRCEPEDLFNEQQRQKALERNSAEIFMDAEQVHQIMTDHSEEAVWAKLQVERLLSSLPNERQKLIVMARMDGATLDEIGADWGISKERVRGLEANAFRRMKFNAYTQNGTVNRMIMLGEDK